MFHWGMAEPDLQNTEKKNFECFIITIIVKGKGKSDPITVLVWPRGWVEV